MMPKLMNKYKHKIKKSESLQNSLALLVCAICLGVNTTFYEFGKYNGKKEGRAEYQMELIFELQAKGGAPVLIYPDESWSREDDKKAK